MTAWALTDFRSRGSPTHLLGVLSGMEFNNQPHIIIDIGAARQNWFWVMVKSHVPKQYQSLQCATAEYVTTDPQQRWVSVPKLTCAVRWSALLRICMCFLRTSAPSGGNLWHHWIAGDDPRARRVGYSTATHYDLSLKDLRELVLRLRKLRVIQNVPRFQGCQSGGQEIILAGAVILQEAMTLGIESHGVWAIAPEGVIVDGCSPTAYWRPVALPVQWAEAPDRSEISGQIEHTERVAAFALSWPNSGTTHTWVQNNGNYSGLPQFCTTVVYMWVIPPITSNPIT